MLNKMFFKVRNNFRPLPLPLPLQIPSNNCVSLSDYIIKTTHNSVKKDCENYVFNKKMRELIENDNNMNAHDNTHDNNTSLSKLHYVNPFEFYLFSISISIISILSIKSFLYFYRCKK